jgi:hypothetical protein
MKLLNRICVAIGVTIFLYFILLASSRGADFLDGFMFTELGIIFFIVLAFFEITFLTM